MTQNVAIVCYRDWALAAAETATRKLSGSGRTVTVYPTVEAVSNEDLVFLVGWSEMVKREFYDNTRRVIVVHPSPLPLYRGGSPIQHQIMAGEKTSAVSLFRLHKDHPATDSGPLCWQRAFSLAGSLDDVLGRIEKLTARAIEDTARSFWDGSLVFTPQPAGEWERHDRRKPSESEITVDDLWPHGDAVGLYHKIRALAPPYPQAYIVLGDYALVIESATVVATRRNSLTGRRIPVGDEYKGQG